MGIYIARLPDYRCPAAFLFKDLPSKGEKQVCAKRDPKSHLKRPNSPSIATVSLLITPRNETHAKRVGITVMVRGCLLAAADSGTNIGSL